MILHQYDGGLLFNADCLDVFPLIPPGSIDLCLTDPPYGTTACKWDCVIPFDKMWAGVSPAMVRGGAIVLFANEPFTSTLVCSNLGGFKYRWDWNKMIPSGMSYARFRPMQQTEDAAVFTSGGEKTVYFPQKTKREKPIKSGGTKHSESAPIAIKDPNFKKTYDFKEPTTLLEFDKIRRGSIHPTQKPVPLLEYLILTYTKEGDTVLDFTMGSGSTGVAARNLKRKFIGIEKEPKYFEIAKERICNV